MVFDDKKIQSLTDEGFYNNLKFENEGEGDLYDSDDDCEDLVQNAGNNISTDEVSIDDHASVENTAEATTETPLDSSVEILSQNSNLSRNH